MKKVVMLLVFILLLSQVCYGAELFKPWADTWTNLGYYQTNFENRNFSGGLGRVEGRLGVSLLPMWGETTFNPYFVYVGVISTDKQRQYYNNNIATGFGARFYPFYSLPQGSFIREIKIFAENLSLSYLNDGENAKRWIPVPGTHEVMPNEDTRFGIDIWYEVNQSQSGGIQSDHSHPWSETWLNLCFRKTNFYQPDFNSFLLQFQNKLGIFTSPSDEVPGIEPYLIADLTMSGKSDFWLNNIQYGIGGRFEPLRNQNTSGLMADLFYKLKIFFEVRLLSYTGSKPTDNRPNSDIRFGFDFTSGR